MEVIIYYVQKDNLYMQRLLRDRPRAQGHILSRLAFLKYLNHWKIAGLWPAIFNGTRGNSKDLINDNYTSAKVLYILG